MLKPKDFPAKKNHIKIPTFFIINNDKFVRGDSGLLSVENKYLLPEELESVRKLAVRFFRKNKTSTMCKNPFLFFRVFPYLSLTAKPKAVRMGKGKGFHVLWVYPINKGKFIFELHGLSKILSLELLRKAQSKLSVKSQIIFSIN